MITLDEVRNAKLNDLYFARIKRQLTWEEAKKVPLHVDEYPEAKNVEDLLELAVNDTLVSEGIEPTEEAIEKIKANVKSVILSGLEESRHTVLMKKNGEYFDLATMEMIGEEYEVIDEVPLSEHASEDDFGFDDEEGRLIFNLEEAALERYLNKHCKEEATLAEKSKTSLIYCNIYDEYVKLITQVKK